MQFWTPKASCAVATILIFSIWARNLEARMQYRDDENIDPEQRVGYEAYNDILSYRPPFDFTRRYDDVALGLLATAGSFNQKRFYFRDELKLATDARELISFRAQRLHEQTLSEDLVDQSLRLQLNHVGPFSFALLADGDSYKERGDLGLAWRWHITKQRELELFFWWVDLFYNDKHEEARDELIKPTRTYGIDYIWAYTDFLEARYHVEYDSRAEWKRASLGYTYTYEQIYHDYRVALGDSHNGALAQLLWRAREKREEKKYLDVEGTDEVGEKKQAVSASHLEAQFNYAWESAADLTAGVAWIRRGADGSNVEPDLTRIDPRLVEPPTVDMHRNEWGIYTTYFFRPEPSSWYGWQYGLFTNWVHLEQDQLARAYTEIKAQWAWAVKASKAFDLFLNTTWDLDEIWMRYPYKSREDKFNPFGGGSISTLIAF